MKTLIQLSDTHLFSDPSKELLGVNTENSFQAILNSIRARKHSMDAFLLTGDLSQDGSPKSYARLAEALNAFDVPIYFIPGNHDNSDVLYKTFPTGMVSSQKKFSLGAWQIILLNSQINNEVEGFLREEELNYLKASLEASPLSPTMIAVHHHPIKIGSKWLDKLCLSNGEALLNITKPYPQVRAILFGHIHQVYECTQDGIFYASVPSTCIQFKNSDVFEVDKKPPGYRLIELQADGLFTTKIYRAL